MSILHQNAIRKRETYGKPTGQVLGVNRLRHLDAPRYILARRIAFGQHLVEFRVQSSGAEVGGQEIPQITVCFCVCDRQNGSGDAQSTVKGGFLCEFLSGLVYSGPGNEYGIRCSSIMQTAGLLMEMESIPEMELIWPDTNDGRVLGRVSFIRTHSLGSN